MSSSKSIALLVCDTPMDSIKDEHGDYSVMFTGLLRTAAAQLGLAPDAVALDAYDVVGAMAYPTEEQLDRYDGVLITGSKFSAYDDVEWINTLVAFTARVAKTRPQLKIIGICFGHQIVARALGGRCVPNSGRWEVGPTPVPLTPLGKELFGVDELYIQEMHQDHVPEVPPSFHLLGSTAVSMNQGMVRFHEDGDGASVVPPSPIPLSSIHIFTVQGHPEFTEPIVRKLTKARAAQGIIPAATAEDADRRAGVAERRVMLGVYGVGIGGVV
ncbi:class I glutamine amidotransferase-like protein [Mycena olivaceomarginata]|nr:class I glutamine amidotransferase-like protein [Mycena olivaceomarginata]